MSACRLRLAAAVTACGGSGAGRPGM